MQGIVIVAGKSMKLIMMNTIIAQIADRNLIGRKNRRRWKNYDNV